MRLWNLLSRDLDCVSIALSSWLRRTGFPPEIDTLLIGDYRRVAMALAVSSDQMWHPSGLSPLFSGFLPAPLATVMPFSYPLPL
jgi:hypothetical protein